MFRNSFLLVLTVLAFLVARPSPAFEVSGDSWSTGQASFYVAIPGFSPSGETWQAAFTRAMNAWTDQTAFQFGIIDGFINPCTGQQSAALGDDRNSAGFATTQCGSAFGENVLAITLTTLSCGNQACTGPKEIIESDIVFNSNLQWDIYSGDHQSNVEDFERVALHELGHALGLNHEFTSDAIMQPFASDLNTLQQDDINGANFIYSGMSSVDSIYGIPIILPAMQQFDGPQDSSNFSGALGSADAMVESKAIDIYQVNFANDSLVTLSMNSDSIDSALILARIDSTQQIIASNFYQDDNSGGGNNAQISQQIPAGTYWIGATSASTQQFGDYDIEITATDAFVNSSLESFTSIYGVDVEINPNPQIVGALNVTDSQFDNRHIDIYQFEVSETVELRIDARSSAFDTKLLLVDVLSSQQFGSVFFENDDNGGGTNSTIQSQLAPGTYWMGVTSFFQNSTGSYELAVTVVP